MEKNKKVFCILIEKDKLTKKYITIKQLQEFYRMKLVDMLKQHSDGIYYVIYNKPNFYLKYDISYEFYKNIVSKSIGKDIYGDCLIIKITKDGYGEFSKDNLPLINYTIESNKKINCEDSDWIEI